MVFAQLAFRGAGFFIFLFPAPLAMSLFGLSLGRKLFFGFLWGVIFAGLFHSWTFFDNRAYWAVFVIFRGPAWLVFGIPQAVLEKWGRPSELTQSLSTGLGLGLATWVFISSPFGLDWEMPMSALAPWPWCLACLPWLGLVGGSFLIGLCSHLILCGQKRALALGLLVLGVWGLLSYGIFESRPEKGIDLDLEIALLQTGWPQGEKWKPKNRDFAKKRLFHMTREAKAKGAELIIWPETAWPIYGLKTSEREAAGVVQLSDELGADILASAIEVHSEGDFNSVSLVKPESGFGEEYQKLRLVPFLEHNYLEFLLEVLPLGLVADHTFLPGNAPVVFQSGGYAYTPLICYESMVPSAVPPSLAAQIDFLVIVTNDAPMRRDFPKEAHFRSAILRAAQLRKPVFQAGNTGVTGIIDPYGVVLTRTEKAFRGARIVMSSEVKS